MIKNLNEDTALKFKNLSAEEKASRGILGRLYGPVADCLNPTRNERRYSEELWEKLFNSSLIKERFRNGGIMGELTHPDRSDVALEKVAIVMPEPPVKDKNGKLVAYVDIIDTPCGRIAYQLAKYGYKFGISSRGEGDLVTDFSGNESVDPDTYTLSAFDLVEIPAVEAARLAFTESLEKKRYNKTLRESLQKTLDNASEDERKIMEEALDTLNIKLNEESEITEEVIDEMANQYEIIIAVYEPTTGERITGYTVYDRAKAFDYIISHPEKNYQLVYERWVNGKFQDNQILARRATLEDLKNYDKSNKKVNLYIDGNWMPKDTDFTELLSAYKDPNKIVLIGFGSKITEELNIDELLESFEFTDKEILDEKFSPESYTKAIRAINDGAENDDVESLKDYLQRIVNYCKDFANDYDIKLSDDIQDESLNINEAQESTAVDNNEAMIEELQEAIKAKAELEQKVVELQEQLSGCFATEAKTEELIAKDKDTIKRLAESAKQAKALETKATTLEQRLKDFEQKNSELVKMLKESKEHETEIKNLLIESKEKLRESLNKNVSLKENYSNKLTEAKSQLNESIESVKKELADTKSKLDNTNKALKESLAKEENSVKEIKILKESVEKEKAVLNENIAKLEKDIKLQKTEYSQKMTKAKQLIEKYQKATNTAVDRYISLQADRLGSSINEIKNRLPESYSFKDIDKVCEDLQDYNLNMSKLPFSVMSKSSLVEDIKIKGTSSRNESILPVNGFDDDVDADLMYLAGK